MQLRISSLSERIIESHVESGRFANPEAVVDAALQLLEQQESAGDFAPGELDRLLAEGERSVNRGEVLDGEAAFARRIARLGAELGRP